MRQSALGCLLVAAQLTKMALTRVADCLPAGVGAWRISLGLLGALEAARRPSVTWPEAQTTEDDGLGEKVGDSLPLDSALYVSRVSAEFGARTSNLEPSTPPMKNRIGTLFCLAPLATGQESFQPPVAPESDSWTTDWVDYDGDGLLDTLVLDPAGPAQLLRNSGDGSFENVTRVSGLGEVPGARKALWNDFDSDGDLDLLLLSPRGWSRLLRADGLGGFEAVGPGSGLDLAGRLEDAKWMDYDNDGTPDLLLMWPGHHRLFHNEGAAQFKEVRLNLPEPTALPSDRATSARARDQASVEFDPRGSTESAITPGPGSGNSAPASPGSSIGAALTCSSGVDDFANPGTCIPGSTTPTLGMLYPISSDWYIDGLGSVGLGTTSPTARLDVDGLIRARSGGVEFPDGTVQSTATLVGPEGPEGPQGIQGEMGPQGPSGSDALWQINGTDMFYENGHVGIGNDDPTARLHVSGQVLIDSGGATGGATRRITIEGARNSAGSAFAEIEFDNFDSSTGNTYTGARIRSDNSGGDDSGDLRFFTNDGGGATKRMTITETGDVALGTFADPSAKLDVDGTIRSRSGGFEFPDGSIQSTAVFEGPQNYTVGPGSFVPRQNAIVHNHWNHGVYVNEVNSAEIIAEVHLPDGARVTGYTVYLNDTVAADLDFYFQRKKLSEDNVLVMGGLFSTAGDSGYYSATNTFATPYTVKNDLGCYSISAFPSGSDDWPGNKDLAIQGVLIHWEMP